MKNDEIKVHVLDKGRKHWYMRFRDPVTKEEETLSTGIAKTERGSRKLAEREAAKWEADLRAGRYKAPSKITWEEFRDQYEEQAVPAMADGTRYPIQATFNSVERHLSPKRLRDIGTAQVTLWQHRLRESDIAEATIRSYSTHLRAALNWAHAHDMLPEKVKVPMPKRARKSDKRTPMKGRPITTEEFERMLAKSSAVVGVRRAESWKHLLRGLWLSGLRIAEAMVLTWGSRGGLTVMESDGFLMLRIDADAEKGNRDRLLPIAPEFAEFLEATPEADRVGFVFTPAPYWKNRQRASQDSAERTIRDIGRAAGVKVLETTRKGKHVTKHASSHDLRRSFGTRWAARVMPTDLMQLMRHEDISTTLRYYVGRDAADLMSRLNRSMQGDTLGDSHQIQPPSGVDPLT